MQRFIVVFGVNVRRFCKGMYDFFDYSAAELDTA